MEYTLTALAGEASVAQLCHTLLLLGYELEHPVTVLHTEGNCSIEEVAMLLNCLNRESKDRAEGCLAIVNAIIMTWYLCPECNPSLTKTLCSLGLHWRCMMGVGKSESGQVSLFSMSTSF